VYTTIDDPKYRRRQLVETTFSVLKRKFGADLKARKFLMQLKKNVCKVSVYNIHRFLQFLIVELFYRAEYLDHRNSAYYKLLNQWIFHTLGGATISVSKKVFSFFVFTDQSIFSVAYCRIICGCLISSCVLRANFMLSSISTGVSSGEICEI
jgi:hypothetical protein